ncbi:MAG TPA: response regulator transcription factor [Candidatus Saccharimonadales bacterium]
MQKFGWEQVVAALLSSQKVLNKLARYLDSLNISLEPLSSWEEWAKIDPEQPLVTDTLMLRQCPPALLPQVRARRSKLSVLLDKGNTPEDIRRAATFFLQSSDSVLMSSGIVHPLSRLRQPAGCDLTDREVDILRLIAKGFSNKHIGDRLHLSEDTVKYHASKLFRKLHVNDRAHAVAIGFQQGLLVA